MRYEVRLPLPPKECSSNFRGHTRSKGKQVRMYRAMCAECYRRAKLPVLVPKTAPAKGAKKVTIHLTFYLAPRYSAAGQKLVDGCYRPKDEDSARYSFKAGQDALQDLGLIPADTSNYVRAGETKLLTRREDHEGMAMVLAVFEVEE